MQVTIRQEPQEILVQTISLTVNKKEPLNVFLFFCGNCGFQISQVQGVVARISPGLEPSEEIVTIHKCPRCGDKYTFQTKKFLRNDRTRVTLISKPNKISVFHCIVCRNPLVQYTATSLVVLPEFQAAHLPLALDCINPQCPQRYLFEDVLS